jgi:peroxiredoxin
MSAIVQTPKILLAGLLLATAAWFSGCKNTGGGGAFGDSVLSGEFSGCGMDTIKLYFADGFLFRQVAAAPTKKSGDMVTFEMDTDLPSDGMYFVGLAPNNLRPVLLVKGEKPILTGDCADLRRLSQITASPANDLLLAAIQRMNVLQQSGQQATNAFMQSQQAGDAAGQEAARIQMRETYLRQKGYVDSMLASNPIIGKYLVPSLYEPFDPGNNPGGYSSDMDFFLATFMKDVDFNDPAYNFITAVPDNMGNFVMAAFSPGGDTEKAEKALDALIAKMKPESYVRNNSLRAIVSALDQVNSTSYIKYAKQFLAENAVDAQVASMLSGRINAYQAQMEVELKTKIGSTPPEIALPTPEGTTFKLSQLRGKVVLIDFWASWCKPCRIENPNVVRMYQAYKGKGFEILGVSLDRDRKSWVDAIKQDGLTWKHVSDLQFWNSKAAQDYYVKAIPATFLLDKEGKIIGKNLRGPALEAKLKEVLGS